MVLRVPLAGGAVVTSWCMTRDVMAAVILQETIKKKEDKGKLKERGGERDWSKRKREKRS